MRSSFSPTLAFYLGKRYFLSLFATTLVLSVFIFILELLEIMRRLSSKPDVETQTALSLILLKMPDMLLQLVPFTILIATLLCFSRLTQNQELIAMRSGGLPARQFLIPPLCIVLLIGAFNLTTLNPFAAATLKRHEHLSNTIFPGSTRGLVTEGGHIWLKQLEDNGDETLIYARNVTDGGRNMEESSLFIFDAQDTFKERIDAQTMTLQGTNWVLTQTVHLIPGEGAKKKTLYTLPTTLQPEMISNSFTSPHTISVWQLPAFIKRLKETGFPTQQHELHLQQTLASPALMLAIFLLAAPFALSYSRNKGTGTLLIIGLCFGFGFHFLTSLIGTTGLSGRLQIELAAWMPTIIAALLGLSFFLHFHEE